MQDRIGQWLEGYSTQKKSIHSKSAIKISVTGGKGGVGKTSISLKLAKSLAEMGFKTLLIDCDYNMSNTAIKLGLPLTNNLLSLLTSQKTFEECLFKDENFHLLSSCNGELDLFENKFELQDIMLDVIASHESDYDYIVMDCPAGLNKESLILNAYSDHRLVVITPDRSSITDSYALMKVLSMKYGIKDNDLLVNMYSNAKQFQRVVKTVSETVEKFLGGRTSIFGGIKIVQSDKSEFDQIFLAEDENEINKQFFNDLKKYVDRGREQWRGIHAIADKRTVSSPIIQG